MVFFSRGHRCAYCERVLDELDNRYNEFLVRGVETVAVSMDSFDQALQMVANRRLFSTPVGFGLTPAQAGAWELKLARTANGDRSQLSVATICLVTPEGGLYSSYEDRKTVALPAVREVLEMLDASVHIGRPSAYDR